MDLKVPLLSLRRYNSYLVLQFICLLGMTLNMVVRLVALALRFRVMPLFGIHP